MSGKEARTASEVLAGRRLLVVEDSAVIAVRVTRVLVDAGATVLGPVATLREALAVVATGDPIDAALVDVDLRGELAYPLCEALTQRRIRFLLVTGLEAAALASPWNQCQVVSKPFITEELINFTRALLDAPAPAPAATGTATCADPDDRRRAEAVRDGRNATMESLLLTADAQELLSHRQAAAQRARAGRPP